MTDRLREIETKELGQKWLADMQRERAPARADVLRRDE